MFGEKFESSGRWNGSFIQLCKDVPSLKQTECVLCLSESLRGARVVVTGASTGIGEQLAYHYARFGAQIVITARREKVLQQVGLFQYYFVFLFLAAVSLSGSRRGCWSLSQLHVGEWGGMSWNDSTYYTLIFSSYTVFYTVFSQFSADRLMLHVLFMADRWQRSVWVWVLRKRSI